MMTDSVDKTLAERESTHGHFARTAMTAQKIKVALRGGLKYGSLNSAQCEALEMIASKMARIVNGDPRHTDSWHDISGFARLVEKELKS